MNQSTGSIPSNQYDAPIKPILKKPTSTLVDAHIQNDHSDSTESKTVTFENFEPLQKQKAPEPIPFWSENPNVLFQSQHILEFFPIESMTYEQKLNAVSRTIIVLTIIALIINPTVRIFMVGAITMGAVFVMYFFHEKERKKVESKKMSDSKAVVGFEGPGLAYYTDNNIQEVRCGEERRGEER